MRRKLINQDVFDSIQNESLSQAAVELVECSDWLSSVIKQPLTFRFFDKEKVVYETASGTYVHAQYSLTKDNKLIFENINELVIDEDSVKQKRRETVGKLAEAVLKNDMTEADFQFEQFVKSYVKAKRIQETNAHKKDMFSKKFEPAKCCDTKRGKMKASKKCMMEANQLSKHVLGYVNFLKTGSLTESDVQTDNKGEILKVTVPTSKLRNEGKVLQFQWKTLKTDCKVLREQAFQLANDHNFCKAVGQVKRLHSLSNDSEFMESLNTLVNKYPGVLYLTQPELANVVKECLDVLAVQSYDDKMCNFLAEGILRTAFDTYLSRASKISDLAGSPISETSKDSYEDFQQAVSNFYPKLDETFATEKRIFQDLYNAVETIHSSAQGELKESAENVLSALYPGASGRAVVDMEIASKAANWLKMVTEDVVQMGSSDGWQIVKFPAETINGDVDDMFKFAKVEQSPKGNTGDWGDLAPASDGKSYKNGTESRMQREKSWGNIGKDCYPDVQNPYLPTAVDFTMKGEKGVDKDNDSTGTWQDDQTWPSLKGSSTGRKSAKDWVVNYGKDKDDVVNFQDD